MQNKTRESITFVGAILGIIVAAITICNTLGISLTFLPKYIHPDAATELLNIFVLLFFYFSLKPKKLELNQNNAIIELAKRLDIEDRNYAQLQFNNERVNKLVKQIVNNLMWFIGTLLIFFVINLLKDLDKQTFQKWNSPFPFLDFFETIANGVSAAFIYLTFSILYDTTLDGQNNTSNYYRGTILFLIVFFLSYFLLLQNLPKDQKLISDIFKLLCGIYNGLAMGLLFGRINSMEFYFKDLNNSDGQRYRKTYQFGVTFILPLYVLAQPMYGVFEFDLFQTNADIFKSIVFLVCFIGKGFFLLFITNRINDQWLHAYLHLALANHDRSRSVIDTISKSQKTTIPEPSVMSIYLLNIVGEYEYTCVQRNSQHSHGGKCTIEEVTNFQNVIEWKLRGERLWSQDGPTEKQIYQNPFQWETVKGAIFKDKSYFYTYHINVEENSLSGISNGKVIFSEDQKEIIELQGVYYQQAGNQIVWGTEHFKKK